MNLPKVLYVEWLDACSPGGTWHHMDDVPNELVTCASIGFLIAEDKKALTLAAHYVEHPLGVQTGGELTILKASITKRRVVRS